MLNDAGGPTNHCMLLPGCNRSCVCVCVCSFSQATLVSIAIQGIFKFFLSFVVLFPSANDQRSLKKICIYWRYKITPNMSFFLWNRSKWSEFMLKTRTNIYQLTYG